MVFQIGRSSELKSSRIVYAVEQPLCSGHVICGVFYYANHNRYLQKLIQHRIPKVPRHDRIHGRAQLALPDGFRSRVLVHRFRAIHNDDYYNIPPALCTWP